MKNTTAVLVIGVALGAVLTRLVTNYVSDSREFAPGEATALLKLRLKEKPDCAAVTSAEEEGLRESHKVANIEGYPLFFLLDVIDHPEIDLGEGMLAEEYLRGDAWLVTTHVPAPIALVRVWQAMESTTVVEVAIREAATLVWRVYETTRLVVPVTDQRC